MIEAKIVSSLEKCFLDRTPSDYETVSRLRMYKNERAAVQFLAYNAEESGAACHLYHLRVNGETARFVTVRTVENVINYCPAFETPEMLAEHDPGYLRTTPGLYPDVLVPPMRGDCVPLINRQLHAVHLTFEGEMTPGEYPTTVSLTDDDGTTLAEASFTLTVMDAELPEPETRVTNWFHADCLADYYHVEPWSERHFAICESFIECAVKNGINMILMPVFTPPLDTHIGGERTTTQLVRVSLDGGRYSFAFDLVDRWIAMCLSHGVKYIEVSHLFSQWGAKYAPKVMATVDGEYKRIFGWDTDASGDEYVRFLRAFLTAFTAHMESLGLKDRTYFHLSDEPQAADLEQYKKNRDNVADLLDGWKILDALSHVEYYREGLIKIPVPVSRLTEEFLKEDIAERWVYYCCDPWLKCSNRLLAVPLSRTRSIGMQMYKTDTVGLLHWGYNFYNNQGSYDAVNPYLNTAGGYWCASGDAFVVYPGTDGTPLESIRLRAYKQGLDDIRVMKLAERYYGKDAVVKAIEAICGTVTYLRCVDDTKTMQAIRDRLDDMILAKL